MYGGRVILAVAGGYVLGRTKKMKLAIMLAGMASGNKIARDPAQLLAQGTRLVQSSPQLSALSDEVRGRLVDAGKGIAVAVVSKQMDSLSDRLSERTNRLSGRSDERTGSVRRVRSGRATAEADLDDDEWDDDQRDDDDWDEASPPRKRDGTSTEANGSDKAAGSALGNRPAGGSQRGEHNA